MPIRRLLAWLSILLIVGCNIGMAWVAFHGSCSGILRICGGQALVADLIIMSVAGFLPLTLLIVLGLRAGLHQFWRTRRALQELLALPHVSPPPVIMTLARRLRLDERIDVVACSASEAFCYGFLHPRIYLTTGLLDRLTLDELDAVLCHERHHLRRRDPLRTLLWTALDHACWWLDHASEQAGLQRELAADRAVIHAGGRQPLAGALLKLMTQTQGMSSISGDLAVGRLSVTDARIDQLLHPELIRSPAPAVIRRLALPMLITTALLICTLLMLRV